MQKVLLLILSLVTLLGCSNGTKFKNGNLSQKNVDKIKTELNIPYSTFSKGYEKMDAEILTDSYTADALLINVYNGIEPKSFKGEKNILNFFSENLERAKRENLRIKATFKITNRKIMGEAILDNGYYKLEILTPNQNINERYGKFSIVLKQESGEWKFSVDTNASSNQKEYQDAESI